MIPNFFYAVASSPAKTAYPRTLRVPDLSTTFTFTSRSYHFIHEAETIRLYAAVQDWESEVSKRSLIQLEPENKLDIFWAEVQSILGGLEWEATISGKCARPAKTDPE